MTTITGKFTSFNLKTDLPHLRMDDGNDVLVGVPRGEIEEFARKCWREKVQVEISGVVTIRGGKVRAINVESITAVKPITPLDQLDMQT